MTTAVADSPRPGTGAQAAAPPVPGYGRVAIALHWLVAAALFAQIGFGFLLDDLAPRGTPGRAAMINLHKSLGICLGLFIAGRLVWRLTHAVPAFAGSMPRWQRRAAQAMHAALYACMLALPLAGYLASNFSKHGVRFFGTRLAPWGPDLTAVYAFFNGLHVVLSWLLCALIALHVLAALKHALIDRDTVFSRMWPRAAR